MIPLEVRSADCRRLPETDILGVKYSKWQYHNHTHLVNTSIAVFFCKKPNYKLIGNPNRTCINHHWTVLRSDSVSSLTKCIKDHLFDNDCINCVLIGWYYILLFGFAVIVIFFAVTVRKMSHMSESSNPLSPTSAWRTLFGHFRALSVYVTWRDA